MKVSELIALLQTQPQDAVVFCDVFEDQGEITRVFTPEYDAEDWDRHGERCLVPYAKGCNIIEVLRSDLLYQYKKENGYVIPAKENNWQQPSREEQEKAINYAKTAPLPPFICLMTNT